jgi:alpha 1,2-mannosyltransferase
VDQLGAYPDKFSGRGIVICAGGVRYFTCAWVNIAMLRQHGCQLPIEIWYTGNELNQEVIEELGKLHVVCKNSNDYNAGKLNRFALKPFAILNSAFKEVLYLDADNNCLTDPTALFDGEQYRTHGAVFWPDFWTMEKSNPMWRIVGAQYADSAEQESGQILINKQKHWKAMNLCLYFNIHCNHYYKMLLGDKDTFRFAWMALRAPYCMVGIPVGMCGFRNVKNGLLVGTSMVQHDFQGNILFLHRNLLKWDVTEDLDRAWLEVVRYKPDAMDKRMIKRIVDGVSYICVDGDVETASFTGLFGDYELRCLAILSDLRNAPFYARFLIHFYYSRYKPGYGAASNRRIAAR